MLKHNVQRHVFSSTPSICFSSSVIQIHQLKQHSLVIPLNNQSFSKRYLSREVQSEINNIIWPILHGQMIEYFKSRPRFNTDIHLHAWERPKSYCSHSILEDGYIPGRISGNGMTRNIIIKTKDIFPYAFDEPDAHLSFYFKSRLVYLRFNNCVERVVVSDVKVDTVDRVLLSIEFLRYLPGIPTSIDVPLTTVGAIGSACFRKGYHAELSHPTVPCVVKSDVFPEAFWIDLSVIKLKRSRGRTIYLSSLENQLPSDKSIQFRPDINPETYPIAWIYGRGTLTPRYRQADWQDPNFLDKKGNPVQLTYKGVIPKMRGTLKKKQ